LETLEEFRRRMAERAGQDLIWPWSILWPILSVIIDPEQLNRVMQANSYRLAPAELMIPTFRLAVLVPAGEEVELPLLLPEGYVCTRRYPITFSSNYYSEDLLVDLSVDGRKVNPYPMPLTGRFDVDFGAYYVKFHDVTINIYNNTTRDVTVTVQCSGHFIKEDRQYHNWYKPIIEFAYDLLTELAKARLREVRA